MQQYYPDPKLKRILERTQYKKHPKWAKRKWVRRILAMIVPISGIIIYFYNINTPKPIYVQDELFIKVTNISIPLCMAIFFSIPYIAYRKILEGSCVTDSRDRDNDTLVITDEELKYIYHPSYKSNMVLFTEFQIRFEDITKIIYNTYNNRVDVYGKQKEIYYRDFTTGEIARVADIDDPNETIRLYLYFEENEEILKTLQERSTAEMKIIDYPTE
ncbi:hypothetical protein [Inconstantimicrobium mannanitabidum]|uniref:Uncharacterized protein n=1 Tax=Inconstantimicrobium mannanitabidum TaxID=1604901 RepID=A0ACB5R6N8_9CLOT|nr:hypothetical protein [Clostridium sp. TW13]GKX64775.1 hypothetical protein rsdtw13_00330 [Clostridium sp. TW13]